MSDNEQNFAARQQETAEADVASVDVGDSPSDVEAKVIGLTHIAGVPSHDAKDADEADSEAKP
jgi:hypothetical protein